jgi:hypothetical protein
MRIAVATFSSLLFACSVSMAQTPVQQVTQDNAEIRQLNTDVRNNEADVRKDSADARHDQSDINRDRGLRSLDQTREDQDLAHSQLCWLWSASAAAGDLALRTVQLRRSSCHRPVIDPALRRGQLAARTHRRRFGGRESRTAERHVRLLGQTPRTTDHSRSRDRPGAAGRRVTCPSGWAETISAQPALKPTVSAAHFLTSARDIQSLLPLEDYGEICHILWPPMLLVTFYGFGYLNENF